MKKILFILLAAIIGCASAQARKTVSRDINTLPAAARTMIKQNFGKVGVNHINIDKDLLSTEYEVILNNGTEIDFDGDGKWKEVDCGNSAVPAALVMKSISNYVKSNYNGSKIVKIERDGKGYEIELLNGVDLKFGPDGRFLKIDD